MRRGLAAAGAAGGGSAGSWRRGGCCGRACVAGAGAWRGRLLRRSVLRASLVQRVAQARATVAASAPTAPAQPTQQTSALPAPAAAAPAPAIPTRASVARTATESDAITLSRLNLIGVYGSPSDRRALLRLPSGRYVKVKVGDRIDGGQVAQIGQGELQYVKDGRTVTLAMPRG